MKKQTTALRRRSFERVVVLVDITVVLLQHEPKKLFAAHVFNTVSRILQLCNEESKFSTLWGYKFFDPFHSPSTFRSKIDAYLDGVQTWEQFDACAPNLEKFGKVLDLVVNSHRQYSSGGSSRGDYFARVIKEVICNYTWDPLLGSDSSSSDEEPLASKERLGGDGAKGDSNAIVLFSSVPTTWTGAHCFFNVPQLVADVPPDPSAQGVLTETFGTVREALKSRNIQVCFVDVPKHQGFWSDERLETLLKPTAARSLILKTLSILVRTVIASDLLVVGPALLPCNLVWNTMADLEIEKSSKRNHARILCPGDTLLCEVQLQRFHVVHTPSTSRTSVLKTKLLPATGNLDIVLESAQPKSSFNMKLPSERFLVRQSVCPKEPLLGEDRDSFGDKVLQILDRSAFRPGQPGWQLLLLTLASRKSVCEISLRIQKDRDSLRAILEPFTSQWAILNVFEKEIIPTKTDSMPTVKPETKEESAPGQGLNVMKRRKDAYDYPKHEGVIVIPSRKRRKVVASEKAVISWVEYWEREATISASTEFTSDYGTVLSRYIAGGKASQLLQTMDSLFKERPPANRETDVVAPLAVMDIGVELSADQACAPAAHPDCNDVVVLLGMVSGQNTEATALDFIQLQEGSEVLALVDAEGQEGSKPVADAETPAHEADLKMNWGEANEYIASVGQKIEHYLASTDVDSGRFAGMLVAESYRSFSLLTRQTEDDQQRPGTGEPAEPSVSRKIAENLKKLLLKSLKRLLVQYKNCEEYPPRPSSGASMDDKFKEYELQILLRLEMISFEGGLLLEQTAKDQLVKDVCKLLDNIQFHIVGGIFGGKNFLNYCNRLLVSRYKKKIPSIISKIYSEMELDGYSLLPTSTFAQESLQESSLKVPAYAGDLFEAGVSQDSMSYSERISSSANAGVPPSSGPGSASLQPTLRRSSSRKPSREDSKGEVQPCILAGPKKGSYHFSSQGSTLVRTRKFKLGGRQTSAHSKQSKGSSRPNIPLIHDPVQVVCQTPAPMTAPSSLRPGDLPQVATLAPPKEFTDCSPKHERVRVEQPPSVVAGTPVVRRRLTLYNFGQENSVDSEIGLDEMVADIARTSDARPNLSAACPSKMSLGSLVTGPCRKSVAPRDSSGRKQGVLSFDLSFSALLKSVIKVPSRTEVGKWGSHRGGHICHNRDDDVDDDDEDGIISTPFKVNASGQSLPSLQSSQSDCHK